MTARRDNASARTEPKGLDSKRSLVVRCGYGFGCAAVAATLLGFLTSSAAGQPDAAKTTVVTVTAGKPGEFAFTLSKTSLIAAGPVTFKVTNKGVLTHDFKICTVATASTTPKNSCVGRVTPILAPGKSASLTVTLPAGTYEYLSTEPKDTTHGMKALLGVGVKAPAATPSTTTTPVKVSTTPLGAKTVTTTTTTATVTPLVLVGDPVNGALVYHSAGCDACHHLLGTGPNSRDGQNLDTTTYATQAPYVTEITKGDTDMPAYSATLSASEINDVAAYVFLSSHR